jgi:hypothetical protein
VKPANALGVFLSASEKRCSKLVAVGTARPGELFRAGLLMKPKRGLAEAERRLVDARAHVRRQKELIESLERDGLSVAAEFTTLKNLQTLVRLRLENRDQLRRELHKPL